MDDPAIQSVMAAKQAALQAQILMALAGKQLSAQKQQGQAMVELIKSAANVGKAIGSGANFDAFA
jgi:hypothetical protein